MKRLLACLAVGSMPTPGFAQIDRMPDLDCPAMTRLVQFLERGPDATVEVFTDDPRRFAERSMSGWLCMTSPFPPERHGRRFLEGIHCFQQIQHGQVNEDDRIRLGAWLRRQIGTLYACFDNQILTEAPVDYDHGSTFQEKMMALLDRGPPGYKINASVAYGRAIVGDPIYVGFELNYGTPPPPPEVAKANSGLCDEVAGILSRSQRNFSALRGKRDREMSDAETTYYDATVEMTGAGSCFVYEDREDAGYSCSWRFRDVEAARADFQAKLLALGSCPSAQGEPVVMPGRNEGDRRITIRMADGGRIRLSQTASRSLARVSLALERPRR